MNPNDSKVSRRQLLVRSAATVGGIAGLAAAGTRAALAQQGQANRLKPLACTPVAPGGTLPVQDLEHIMMTNNHILSNGVLVINFARKDLNVTGPNGHPFKPAFAPLHHFFFEPLSNGDAFMNAEFTFTPGEMGPVLDAIMSTPLQIMAEHQHYIGEKPQLFHVHFRGKGKATDVAQWAMKVVRATSTPLPQPVPANMTSPLPHAEMAKIIGGSAHMQPGGVVLITKPIMNAKMFFEDGVQLKPQMNVLQKISFEPLDNSGRQANCGADFIMVSGQVNPALRKAHQEGFGINCLYNQETDIEPQPYFSHNLLAGDPLVLARKVRAVLDVIDSTPIADPACGTKA